MDSATLLRYLTVGGLIAIMLGVGLSVRFQEVLAAARKPRLLTLSLVGNFILVPAVTIGLLQLFQANPMVSVGFLILAVCPGAPLGPPFAVAARGDVPCAVGQMVILASLSALLSPLLLSGLLSQLVPDSDIRVDYLAIVRTLLVAQVVPLGIGMAIHHRRPGLASRIVGPIRLLSTLLLLAAVVLVLAQERETLLLIRGRGWLAMLLLLAISLGIGWLAGGPGRATRKSLALTTAVRNIAVGLVIVSDNFSGTAAVTAVIAYGFVSIFGALVCAFLLARLPEPAA